MSLFLRLGPQILAESVLVEETPQESLDSYILGDYKEYTAIHVRLAASRIPNSDIAVQQGDYTVEVGIGTPPQKLRLLVGNDATRTWMLDSSCDTDLCKIRTKFDGSKSSTFAGFEKKRVTYAGASNVYGMGYAAQDTLTVCLKRPEYERPIQ